MKPTPNGAPPPELADLPHQILACTESNRMLEEETVAYTMETEKYQEQILELENWIYLINALKSDPGSNKINDVDHALKFVGDLREESLQLRKDLLFETKRQYDTRQTMETVLQKQAIETEELANLPEKSVDDANREMENTMRLLREEQAGLLRDNARLDTMIQKRPPCVRLAEVNDQIRLLKTTRKTISVVKLAQLQE